jgi:low affinity Fe/Cu permease
MNSPGSWAKSNPWLPDTVAEPEPPGEPSRSLVSRWLSRVDRLASRPAAALLVLAAVVSWLVVSLAAGFPARWETVFQTLVAALTLAMVFVIQHTQARHQRATQRKLDEILHALPDADNSLITLEHASDEELHATGHEHRRRRQAALDDQAAAGE